MMTKREKQWHEKCEEVKRLIGPEGNYSKVKSGTPLYRWLREQRRIYNAAVGIGARDVGKGCKNQSSPDVRISHASQAGCKRKVGA
jgi:hypothetical protein